MRLLIHERHVRGGVEHLLDERPDPERVRAREPAEIFYGTQVRIAPQYQDSVVAPLEQEAQLLRVDQVIEGVFLRSQCAEDVAVLELFGQLHPDEIVGILVSEDRRQAGTTAPARGLVLEWVEY